MPDVRPRQRNASMLSSDASYSPHALAPPTRRAACALAPSSLTSRRVEPRPGSRARTALPGCSRPSRAPPALARTVRGQAPQLSPAGVLPRRRLDVRQRSLRLHRFVAAHRVAASASCSAASCHRAQSLEWSSRSSRCPPSRSARPRSRRSPAPRHRTVPRRTITGILIAYGSQLRRA